MLFFWHDKFKTITYSISVKFAVRPRRTSVGCVRGHLIYAVFQLGHLSVARCHAPQSKPLVPCPILSAPSPKKSEEFGFFWSSISSASSVSLIQVPVYTPAPCPIEILAGTLICNTTYTQMSLSYMLCKHFCCLYISSVMYMN